MHVNRGEVAQEDTQRMREILVASKRQRGALVKDSKYGEFRGGRRKKWCIAGGGRMVLDKPQHLAGPQHNLKRGSWLHNEAIHWPGGDEVHPPVLAGCKQASENTAT